MKDEKLEMSNLVCEASLLERSSEDTSCVYPAVLSEHLTISELALKDYEQLPELWAVSNIDWSDVDTEVKFARFLVRNMGASGKGLSSVVRYGERIVGVLLCADDGLCAYIYHMAVDPEFRRCGVGTMLARRSMAELKSSGVEKCRLFVRQTNLGGGAFWSSVGFQPRDGIYSMSVDLDKVIIDL